MAVRPVFAPSSNPGEIIRIESVEFDWFPGFSVAQKQRSIKSLHDAAARKHELQSILDISSKSPSPDGVALSAFNLSFLTKKTNRRISVECVFQASKVFTEGGPFEDLLGVTSREAKKDERLRNSGRLTAFHCFGVDWPLTPQTAFYDWLYINSLVQNPDLAEAAAHFDAFTDIEFNPERSLNCQARSAALFVSLKKRGLLEEATAGRDRFLELMKRFRVPDAQGALT